MTVFLCCSQFLRKCCTGPKQLPFVAASQSSLGTSHALRQSFSTPSRRHFSNSSRNEPRKSENDPKANRGAITREYFYWIDKDGKLYLEETTPKIFTTALRDVRFLDFFFRRIRDNNAANHSGTDLSSADADANSKTDTFVPKSDYPYLSKCGNEMNFIKVETAPIVFHDLRSEPMSESSTTALLTGQSSAKLQQLVFGGSLTVDFDPTELVVLSETSKLYHKLPDTVKCSDWKHPKVARYGVIGSHLLLRLTHDGFLAIESKEDLEVAHHITEAADEIREEPLESCCYLWKDESSDNIIEIPIL